MLGLLFPLWQLTAHREGKTMAQCEWCDNEMTTGASCIVEALHQAGVPRPLEAARRRCGDCGVRRGGLHHPGCDLQRCPCCHGQLITCGCRFDEIPPDADEWDGDDGWDEGDEFPTRLELADGPFWGPLEAVAKLARSRPDLPSFHEGEFMYMSAVRSAAGRAVHLYKHIDTRHYLNLDEDGRAYVFMGRGDDADLWSGGWYRRCAALAEGIDGLDLAAFETDSLFRSFPPEDWPREDRPLSLVPPLDGSG